MVKRQSGGWSKHSSHAKAKADLTPLRKAQPGRRTDGDATRDQPASRTTSLDQILELTDETAHRALAYVAAVQRQGYVMTVEELEVYIARPGQRPGTPGTPGDPERRVVTTQFDRALANWLQSAFQPAIRGLSESIARGLQTEERVIPGTPGIPGEPAESVGEWLSRLRWLQVDDGRVRTTQLGEALLAHLEQASLEEEIPVGVVLDQGDELAEARVVQQIAEIGPCAVVDRFFSMDSLLPVLYSTQVEAVLMGSDAGGKLAGVETALRRLTVERPFEVRKSDVFHDRFVIPPHGPVWALGTSLTGLSRRLSIMVRIDDETMSSAIRRTFGEVWEAAEVVANKEPEPVGSPPDDEPDPQELDAEQPPDAANSSSNESFVEEEDDEPDVDGA